MFAVCCFWILPFLSLAKLGVKFIGKAPYLLHAVLVFVLMCMVGLPAYMFHMQHPQRPEEGLKSPGAAFTESDEPPCGERRPSREQSVLLTAELPAVLKPAAVLKIKLVDPANP